MTDPTAPERIWLNTAGCYDEAHEHADEMGVTWCKEPQDDDDQEYVRADLHAAMQAENARLLADLLAAMQAENARLRAAFRQIETDLAKVSPTVECETLRVIWLTTRAALEGEG